VHVHATILGEYTYGSNLSPVLPDNVSISRYDILEEMLPIYVRILFLINQ